MELRNAKRFLGIKLGQLHERRFLVKAFETKAGGNPIKLYF